MVKIVFFPFLRFKKDSCWIFFLFKVFFKKVGRMSLHIVKKILPPGKGSEISHLISELLQMPHFPKPVCHLLYTQVLNSRKVGLKMLNLFEF